MTQFGTHTFQYDAFDCRTFKNQIEYTYDDQGRLLKEVNDTHTILYFYDGLSICSIQVDGQSYFLRRNLFQDVTHIYDLNGNLVASYLYDAWGNHQVFDASGVENTNADFIIQFVIVVITLMLKLIYFIATLDIILQNYVVS